MTAHLTEQQWAELRSEAKRVSDAELDRILGGKPRPLPPAFLPYQSTTIALLESVSTRVLFVEKSRRVGLTWSLAAYAVLKAGRSREARGADVYYISYAQAMTRDFIADCAGWARSFNQVVAEVEEFLWNDGKGDDGADRNIQAFRITFASGHEIVGLSSAPRSLRGKQGVVIIDEAAFVDDLKELLKAALALLMWGGQVIVCSTHNGAENEFNLQVQDILGGRKPYKHLRIDFDEALQEGLYERICMRTGEAWSPEAEGKWRREIVEFYGDGADEELYCVPSMGSGSWLTAPLIEARMTADAPVLRLELPENYLQLSPAEQAALTEEFEEELKEALAGLDLEQLLYSFGFDFGRVADLSVGTLLSIDQAQRRREALTFEFRNVPGDEQKRFTRMLLTHVRSRLVGGAFDATGMGWTVAEDLGRSFGLRSADNEAGLIWAIKFTEDWYRINMPPLKVAFEDDAIALANDRDHASDLRAVKVIRGIPRLPQTRQGEGTKKRHGDFAIALALAHFASRHRWAEYSYASEGRRPGRFDEVGEAGGLGSYSAGGSLGGEEVFRMSSMRSQKGMW